MAKYLSVIAFLLLSISCNAPCEKFHKTPVYEVIDEILKNPEIPPGGYFNILKISFDKSYDGKHRYLDITNDPFYSEELNDLKLDGWIEMRGIMVAFYKLDEYPNNEDIKSCLNTGEPPKQFLFETEDSDDFNPRIWRFDVDEDGTLNYTGKSPPAFTLSKERYE
ncbi:hypothetical protein [Sinomicrobium weinanense]|uniref:Uncharacterized protein n=1 Tax=Sinomicrobium weinanense TaxID=2842200 RepID=A0A926Q4R8_9FLAO|nr:hypothetical protein [Sinomicrobium weinanense]MBC9798279.1 hypothetical protein [Sinomicrobium weinanense]MBU3125089.1 hypothetical protein [Sinomicrobium weinanense]